MRAATDRTASAVQRRVCRRWRDSASHFSEQDCSAAVMHGSQARAILKS